MITRGHLEPAELDAMLLGTDSGDAVTVERFHLQTCRTCRQALLDRALMAGLLRRVPMRPPPDRFQASGMMIDAEMDTAAPAVEEPRAARAAMPRFSRKRFAPAHPDDATLQALLASASDERVRQPDGFLQDVRHVSRCDQCLARVLRLAEPQSPSAGRVQSILRALAKGPGKGWPLFPESPSCSCASARSSQVADVIQSSTFSPGTRSNSRALCVTSVMPRERACAAMNRSWLPIGVPARSSVARMSA